MRGSSGQYDKVLKEIMEKVFPFLMSSVIHLDYEKSEELPDSIQRTTERIPDLLKRITLADGSQFILHVEFQTSNEARMAYRMFEYLAMLTRIYSLDVIQYVVYMDPSLPVNMKTELQGSGYIYYYNLFSIPALDAEVFLNAPNPEGLILVALTNFASERTREIVEQVFRNIRTTTRSEHEQKKHFEQFRILLNIRKFDKALIQSIMIDLKEFDPENDVFYMSGVNKGKLEGKEEAALKMFQKGLELEFVQEITGLTTDRLNVIRDSLKTQ